MNRRDELPEELHTAYDEGYELAKAKGWLDDMPFGTKATVELTRFVFAKQIGFIDGLKEIWPKK